MTFQDIYQQYDIPRNLQRHMCRVAAVGEYIAEHSTTSVDTNSIVETLLCHDLGNVLKFDFSQGLALFDTDEQDLSRWQGVQQKFQEEYGSEVHDATLAIAQEIGMSERVIDLLQQMGSSHLETARDTNDWETKICVYADFRVDPHGFVDVTTRFADIEDRYASRQDRPASRERTRRNRDMCLQLEAELNEHTTEDILNLPYAVLEKRSQQLLQWTPANE